MVLGIIAEFNPFHNGHLHLLTEARKKKDFSGIICVMSGHFLQRGEVALCNKWARAEMALKGGVDLVIELPFSFAVRSANFFARGGIELLSRLGIVTHLAFGSESGHLEDLQAVATMLTKENDSFKFYLKQFLDQGLSFPAARAQTLKKISTETILNMESILSQPNNILAIEYLRVLQERDLPIRPLVITRRGSGYHNNKLSTYASATAIRRALLDGDSQKNILATMPATSWAVLKREINAGRAPITLNSMEQALLAQLRLIPVEELSKVPEITEGLENRIHRAALTCGTLEELRAAIKSKRYSLTRINRLLLYTILKLEQQQLSAFDQQGPLYAHILGISSQGFKLLKQIRERSSLPILSRGSSVKRVHKGKDTILSAMINLDIKASDLFTLYYPQPTARKGGQDFTTSPIIA